MRGNSTKNDFPRKGERDAGAKAPRRDASAGNRRGSCRLPSKPPPMKMQCGVLCRSLSKPRPVKTGQRSARRRSAVPNLKIIFPLLMRRAARRAFKIVHPSVRSDAAGKVSACRQRAGRSAGGFLLPVQSGFAWGRLDAFCKMHRRRGCSLLPPKEKKSAAVPAGHESPSGAFKPQTGLRSKCRVFSAARSQRFRRAGSTN